MTVVTVLSTAHADQRSQTDGDDKDSPVELPYLCSVAHRFTEVQFLILLLFDAVNPVLTIK